MTIVYFDPLRNEIGVDSLVSFSSGKSGYTGSKIIRDVGGAVALAGFIIPVEHVAAVILDEFHTVLLSEPNSPRWPRTIRCGQQSFSDDVEVNGYARTATGEVYFVSLSRNVLTAIRVDPHPDLPAMAEGSGYAWFDAYVADGSTPREAAEKVARFHEHCGGAIETF